MEKNLTYVDNSNVYIEGCRVSAGFRGFSVDHRRDDPYIEWHALETGKV